MLWMLLEKKGNKMKNLKKKDNKKRTITMMMMKFQKFTQMMMMKMIKIKTTLKRKKNLYLDL